jgi:ABC-type Fe3+/spermidine/putrescine transport system ATPase subunit
MQDDIVVDLQKISKNYGEVQAVKPLDLQFHRGEFVAILGPSGCGKTTLLRIIGGFLEPSCGAVIIGGKNVTRLGPDRRPTNMVFQGYGLFPHMTVIQNIRYGLRVAKMEKTEADARVSETIDLVNLEGFESRSVTELSGGQQQRVALARALVMRPEVLLLDEPLAALDLKLRKAMQSELRQVHHSTGGTFVFVTHDQEEAMALATRVIVMESGSVVQQGRPEDIYSSPNTPFISTFIGEANILLGVRKNNQAFVEPGLTFSDTGPDEEIVCIVRPENVALAVDESDQSLLGKHHKLFGTLLDVVFLGPFVKYTIKLKNGATFICDLRDSDLREQIAIRQSVIVAWSNADQKILSNS